MQHIYIYHALQSVGFGTMYIQCVKNLHSNATSRPLINGTPAEPFKIMAGVRQGDPLSGFLFIASMECFAHAIRQHSAIVGAKIGPTTRKKINLHCDDIALLMDGESSAKQAVALLDLFCQASGLRVSSSKTVVRNPVSTNTFGFSPLKSDGTRYLGFLATQSGLVSTFSQRMEKLKSVVKNLNRLPLSIFGKRNMWHSYGSSILLYESYLVSPTEESLKDLDSVRNSFFWKSRPLVSLQRLQQTPEEGGIGLFNDSLRFKASKLSLLLRLFRDEKLSITGASILEHFKTQICRHGNGVQILSAIRNEWLKAALTALYSILPDQKQTIKPNTKIHESANFWSLLPTQSLSFSFSLRQIYTLFLSQESRPKLSFAQLEREHSMRLPTLQHMCMASKPYLRPMARQFQYLWLANSLPIKYGDECPFCEKQITTNHLFLTSRCSTTTAVNRLYNDPADPKVFYLSRFVTWKIFNKVIHGEITKTVSDQNDFLQLHRRFMDEEIARLQRAEAFKAERRERRKQLL